jgi:hypothetical protein
VPITGEHHGYVVDSLKLPISNSEAAKVAFDLDGDGPVDNQFGSAVGTLVQQGFDSNTAIALGIARGEAILLADLQSTSLVVSSFTPDLILNGGSTPDSLSCAFAITGKRATFDQP